MVHPSLGCWQQKQYVFHFPPTLTSRNLLRYRAGQQDSQPVMCVGLLAAADGIVDLRAKLHTTNCQGTGFAATNGAG